jgi:predicted O-methyltransferase YrrM
MKPPYKPELLPVVQYVIEHILSDGGDVFEYGSGNSTVWLAEFADVVTVEHDEEWSDELMAVLEATELKVDCHLTQGDRMAQVINKYDLFDLVFVDCWDIFRNDAVKEAIPHVKPGGWLILDDSHRPMFDRAQRLLKDWHCTVISGLHLRYTGIEARHQTSLYRRPHV